MVTGRTSWTILLCPPANNHSKDKHRRLQLIRSSGNRPEDLIRTGRSRKRGRSRTGAIGRAPQSHQEALLPEDFRRYQKPRQGRRAQHHQQRPQVPAKSNKGKSKGNKGSKGHKGKGKHHIEPPPWSSSAAQPPAPTSATPAQSRAEAKLHEIVSVLKKKDDPELQTLAKEADVLQNKTATSKLHKAVTVHGDAKTAVLEARQARANLHASWKQYLESAITTWRSFLEDFDKEDRRLEELIGKADMNLQAAQNSLDEAKKAATEEELKDQIETIEDEDEGLDRTAKSSQVMREGSKACWMA